MEFGLLGELRGREEGREGRGGTSLRSPVPLVPSSRVYGRPKSNALLDIFFCLTRTVRGMHYEYFNCSVGGGGVAARAGTGFRVGRQEKNKECAV